MPWRLKYCRAIPIIGAFLVGTSCHPATVDEEIADKVWKVTNADRAPGSVYIFLSNGTLMITSCVETYRLATWRAESTNRIVIAEDQATEYTADFQVVSGRIDLRLNLRDETVPLVLEPAAVPDVCPDLPR